MHSTKRPCPQRRRARKRFCEKRANAATVAETPRPLLTAPERCGRPTDVRTINLSLSVAAVIGRPSCGDAPRTRVHAPHTTPRSLFAFSGRFFFFSRLGRRRQNFASSGAVENLPSSSTEFHRLRNRFYAVRHERFRSVFPWSPVSTQALKENLFFLNFDFFFFTKTIQKTKKSKFLKPFWTTSSFWTS